MNVLANGPRRLVNGAAKLCTLTQRMTMSSQRLDLRGVYPPIATPFDSDEEISFKHLETNFSKWNAFGFKGTYVTSFDCCLVNTFASLRRTNIVVNLKPCVPRRYIVCQTLR